MKYSKDKYYFNAVAIYVRSNLWVSKLTDEFLSVFLTMRVKNCFWIQQKT
jgi:hypothetical protein